MYFSSMFSEAKTNVINYNGEYIYNCYFFDFVGNLDLDVEFISSIDDLQCVIMVFSSDFVGELLVNGIMVNVPTGRFRTIDIFESVFGHKFSVSLMIKSGKVGFCNGNRKKCGEKDLVSYASRGHAMKVKKIDSNFYFECNSNETSKKFDDLSFIIRKK